MHALQALNLYTDEGSKRFLFCEIIHRQRKVLYELTSLCVFAMCCIMLSTVQ